MRICVKDVLELFAAGVSQEDILVQIGGSPFRRESL